MGCLARLGCVVLLVAGGVAAWLTRDPGRRRQAPPVAAVASDWSPLSEPGAKRTGEALARLSSPSGPVFVTLGGSDVASYVFLQLARQMPASSDSFAARVRDHQIS